MSKEAKNKLLPKLRFSEFKDIWDEEQLSSLLVYERPDNYIVKDTNYGLQGTPVLTANKSFILGHTQETDGICQNIPAIIFDDFTTDKKYVDFPFKVKSSAIKILRAKDDNNLRFIHELMNLIRFEAKEHKRYYISVYQNLLVPVPKPKEQQKIADCLSSLDDLIDAENKKLESLKAHKKGLLQNLFPPEGENVPKLRFKEFENSGEWEDSLLGKRDIAVFINEKIYTDEIKLESYVSTENLLPDYGGKTIASKLPSTGSVTRFKKEDILLSNIRPYLKKVWFANIDGGASNDVIVIRAGLNIDATFLSFILKNDDFINYIMKGAEGVKMPRGDKELIKEYPVKFPQKPEQEKIADILSLLDELIIAETEKIESLKLHKKGLMQGLFPNYN